MIITKTHLKQIIKEELEKVRLEQIEVVNEEELQEGPIKKFLATLGMAGALVGATAGKAKADQMEIDIHHRQSGEHYTQVVDIPGAKAGMDKFDLQNIAQKFIDQKAEKAGLPMATFVVDEVKPVSQVASGAPKASQTSDSSVSYDAEREVYKVVVPRKDQKNMNKITSALAKHLNKKIIDYNGTMFTEKGPTPETITILFDKAGLK